MKKTILFTLALVPVCAFAVDGVVLINQSTVMAAGGFPYTISQPGSYKLSGNLTAPANTRGIVISASNVTLDLNGFTLEGSRTFPLVYPAIESCCGFQGITIRNGTISNFPGFINLTLATATLLEELILRTGFSGAVDDFGGSGVVRHVAAPGRNIVVTCPMVVSESLALEFLQRGDNTTCTFHAVSGRVTLFP